MSAAIVFLVVKSCIPGQECTMKQVADFHGSRAESMELCIANKSRLDGQFGRYRRSLVHFCWDKATLESRIGTNGTIAAGEDLLNSAN